MVYLIFQKKCTLRVGNKEHYFLPPPLYFFVNFFFTGWDSDLPCSKFSVLSAEGKKGEEQQGGIVKKYNSDAGFLAKP